MPAFNVEHYIAAAIESVLAQTFTDFELLVIDDGSTDATPALIAAFASDTRLRVVTHAKNLGRPAARNHGIDLARGEYIAFLDADDLCAPHRLYRQVSYLDSHAEIAGVGSWMRCIDARGNELSGQTYCLPTDSDEIACRMIYDCALAQGSMMLRRSAFEHHRYDEAFWIAQDYELWARMIATLKFANQPEPLTSYRRHDSQVSVTHTQAQREADLAIYRRQLAALGVHYTESDLIRHGCLFKYHGREPVLAQTGAPLDVDYLRWARNWLEGLLRANERTGIYPQPAFSRMIVQRWLFVCRKAARNSGWLRVAVEFSKLPLLGHTVRHGRQQPTRAATPSN